LGTHANAEVAIIRALTEVAQSRLTQIHRAREGTTKAGIKLDIGYERMKKMNRHWYDESNVKSIEEVDSLDNDDILDDINYMLERLKCVGLKRTIVVNLTRKEVGIPTVRVVVPGLE
jgi:ribosomal protein S12 methylthiotransferase accessory factor